MSLAAASPAQLMPDDELPSVEISAVDPKIGDTVHACCGSCGATTSCVIELVSTPPVEVLLLCDYCSSGPTPWP